MNRKAVNLPVLGGLDGTGLESFDSAVTDNTNDGRFVDTLLGIMIDETCKFNHIYYNCNAKKKEKKRNKNRFYMFLSHLN